jgi:uncharacterized protein YybS (DUF2232 family)
VDCVTESTRRQYIKVSSTESTRRQYIKVSSTESTRRQYIKVSSLIYVLNLILVKNIWTKKSPKINDIIPLNIHYLEKKNLKTTG